MCQHIPSPSLALHCCFNCIAVLAAVLAALRSPGRGKQYRVEEGGRGRRYSALEAGLQEDCSALQDRVITPHGSLTVHRTGANTGLWCKLSSATGIQFFKEFSIMD